MWSRMASARSSLFDISRTFIDTSRPRRFAMRHSGGHPLGVPWSQGGTVNLIGRECNETFQASQTCPEPCPPRNAGRCQVGGLSGPALL